MVYLIGSEPEMGQYPSEKFLDGDPHNIKVEGPETEEMLRAISRNHKHQYNLGFRISCENVPSIWLWKSSRAVPDFYTPNAFPCVSSRFKEVVERFAPDVHQFFPITVVNKAKEKIAERWLWVVCNLIDGVDREHTNLFFQNQNLWTSSYKEDGEWKRVRDPKVAFNKQQTEGFHFWRDKHLFGGGIYVSDEAVRALKSAKIAGLQISYQETV